ncbi:hypothetical protein EDC04DRAFT_2815548 [Pisolithus marmoratus]|nr:hypothetical protein EDC04DRAFT_2815548 [Pisolithus marmoratus]
MSLQRAVVSCCPPWHWHIARRYWHTNMRLDAIPSSRASPTPVREDTLFPIARSSLAFHVLHLWDCWNVDSPSVEILLHVLRGCPNPQELAFCNEMDADLDNLFFHDQEFLQQKFIASALRPHSEPDHPPSVAVPRSRLL